MQTLKCWYRRSIAISFLLLLFGGSVPALAATTKSSTTSEANAKKSIASDISNAVTQSYNADPSVQIAMIVRLKPKDPTTVTPLDNSNIRAMLGVAVPSNQATIVLSSQNIKQQQVLVATSGKYEVLVTNQQGPIKPGDYLTISAISGVAMKAGQSDIQTVGSAAGTFTGSANVIGQVDLKDTTGHTKKVALGRIPVDLNISHNPLFEKTGDYVPAFVGKVATGVANKPVSAARIYLSIIILFVISIITGNVLYAGVRSGMIAVGRNPLSKTSITRSLIQVVIAGLIIFIGGIFAVYLLLKL